MAGKVGFVAFDGKVSSPYERNIYTEVLKQLPVDLRDIIKGDEFTGSDTKLERASKSIDKVESQAEKAHNNRLAHGAANLSAELSIFISKRRDVQNGIVDGDRKRVNAFRYVVDNTKDKER